MKRLNSAKLLNGRGRARRRGAILIEAALVTIAIVIPLLVGIIQFGIYYTATNGLTSAAREGARYAAVYGMRPDLTDTIIKQHVVDAGLAGNIILTTNDVTITPVKTARTQYTPVTVTVSYNLNAKKIMPLYTPGTITRVAQSMLE